MFLGRGKERERVRRKIEITAPPLSQLPSRPLLFFSSCNECCHHPLYNIFVSRIISRRVQKDAHVCRIIPWIGPACRRERDTACGGIWPRRKERRVGRERRLPPQTCRPSVALAYRIISLRHESYVTRAASTSRLAAGSDRYPHFPVRPFYFSRPFARRRDANGRASERVPV